MKFIKQLCGAINWWRVGLSPVKAWQLAGHNVRKANIKNEVIVVIALAAAYAFTAWNDADAALDQMGYEYASAMVQKNKAEIALVNMLSGKAMLIDEKSWTQCYSSTTM